MKRLLFSFFALSTCAATAQFTTQTNLNTVVRDDAAFEEAVPIVASSNGNTIISYFEQSVTNPYNFSVQTLDENGMYAIGPNGAVVSNYPQGTALFTYDMKPDIEGNIVAAFQDERSGSLDVVAYRVSPSGTSIWGAAGVACYDPAAAGGIAPNVGVLSNGDAIVAWVADGSPKDWVSIQRITPLGVPVFSTPVRIIDSTNAASFSRPQVLPLQNGEFMIIYIRQTGNFPPVSTIFARKYDVNGQLLWAQPVQVSTKTIGFVEMPSVVSDGNNGAFVAFTSSNPASLSLNDVWVQRVFTNGSLWSATGTEAITGAASQRMSPKMRFEGTMPRPYVLMKETDPGQTYAAATIQAFDSTTGAALWTSGMPVTTLSTNYDEPYDMRDICGNLMVLFSRGSFSAEEMYAAKIDYNGVAMWPNPFTVLSSLPSSKLRGQLSKEYASQGISQVVAVWEDERNGRGVYAQNIACDGSTGPLYTTGVNETVRPFNSISVVPNPGTDARLEVFSENQQVVTVSLYEATGRCIATRSTIRLVNGANDLSLPALFGSELPHGMYTVLIAGPEYSGQVKWAAY